MRLSSPPLIALALALLATTGCADDGGPIFNNEGGRPISCMQHQQAPPGSRYTDTEQHPTTAVFAVLRYYTANGTKPYCDGARATDADRAWAEVYLHQGAQRANVAPIVGPR